MLSHGMDFTDGIREEHTGLREWHGQALEKRKEEQVRHYQPTKVSGTQGTRQEMSLN